MNKCPNPTYKGIECPFALSVDAPLPCYGSQEQCNAWRHRLEKGQILEVFEEECQEKKNII